jgi:hypothetical protein
MQKKHHVDSVCDEGKDDNDSISPKGLGEEAGHLYYTARESSRIFMWVGESESVASSAL